LRVESRLLDSSALFGFRGSQLSTNNSQLSELLKRELGELVVRQCRFTAQLVTIQQVDVTPDLKHAHVFVSVIGNEEEQKQALATLHDTRADLQRALSKRVVLKYTPHLHFKNDTAAERGDRVLNILEELHLPPEPPAPSKHESE
jgi:ribosome-binding factor A